MSLDVDLMVTQPVSVYSGNITHNLNAMAVEVVLSNGLWRPEDHGLKFARDISELLYEGWNILIADPEKFKNHNPPNGWGSYDGLCNFVYKYYYACRDNPDAELRVSR